MRKSKREKEKEAAEAKRKEEEENAAKAYAEFLDAFQGEEADRKQANSAFVKSGQAAPYEPSMKSRGEPSKVAPIFEQEAVSVHFLMHEMLNYSLRQSPSPPPLPKPKGKRAMDSFLEEIKRLVSRHLHSIVVSDVGVQGTGCPRIKVRETWYVHIRVSSTYVDVGCYSYARQVCNLHGRLRRPKWK